jgi:hypothetical protein
MYAIVSFFNMFFFPSSPCQDFTGYFYPVPVLPTVAVSKLLTTGVFFYGRFLKFFFSSPILATEVCTTVHFYADPHMRRIRTLIWRAMQQHFVKMLRMYRLCAVVFALLASESAYA